MSFVGRCTRRSPSLTKTRSRYFPPPLPLSGIDRRARLGHVTALGRDLRAEVSEHLAHARTRQRFVVDDDDAHFAEDLQVPVGEYSLPPPGVCGVRRSVSKSSVERCETVAPRIRYSTFVRSLLVAAMLLVAWSVAAQSSGIILAGEAIRRDDYGVIRFTERQIRNTSAATRYRFVRWAATSRRDELF